MLVFGVVYLGHVPQKKLAELCLVLLTATGADETKVLTAKFLVVDEAVSK